MSILRNDILNPDHLFNKVLFKENLTPKGYVTYIYIYIYIRQFLNVIMDKKLSLFLKLYQILRVLCQLKISKFYKFGYLNYKPLAG